MLRSLYIQNYALIDELDIRFLSGLTVITGETGAGKSILLGALSLILGKRADTQVLLDTSKKCIVEGVFDLSDYEMENFFGSNDLDRDDEHTIIRREISVSGRSRAFVNDTPVNLSLLQELGSRIIEVHSQNHVLMLNDHEFRLQVVDSYSGLTSLVKEYRDGYRRYRDMQKHLDELKENEKKAIADRDYLSFQLDELEKAGLSDDEQETLEEEFRLLENAGEIKTRLIAAAEALKGEGNSILSALTEVKNGIADLARYGEKFSSMAERLSQDYIDLNDLAAEIESAGEQVGVDPARSEEVSRRLDVIYRLQQKHGVSSVSELKEIRDDFAARLKNIGTLEDDIARLEKEIASLENDLSKRAEHISQKRKSAAEPVESAVTETLGRLGMPKARFRIDFGSPNELDRNGKDRISFMFNANDVGESREVGRIASGGELSRLMLSIKSLLSTKKLLPTVVFDEIDIGISGKIADKMGDILRQLSGRMQVVAITHLPQIAGKGDAHYLVSKDISDSRSKTVIRLLQGEERVEEIARMLSGKTLTDASRETARHLMGE